MDEDTFKKASIAFNAAMKELEKEQEEYWDSLTKEQQLMVFCAVSRRLHKGELQDQGSYRYILYDAFGFEFDSYVAALEAGFMDIHNSMFTRDALEALITRFAEFTDVPEEKIEEFISKGLIY